MKKRILSIITCLALCLGLLPAVSLAASAADTGKAIHLGTGGISDPTEAQGSATIVNDTYSGTYKTPSDYVYFGVNGSEPIKWRVLDADKTNDGATSGMFLLSEYLLASGVVFEQAYNSDDSDGQINPNEWQHSDAQTWCSTFAANTDVFSSAEQAAFLGVKKTDSAEGHLYSKLWGTSGLTENDKVFFLSVMELADYVGDYYYAPGLSATDTKQSGSHWWLRSPLNRDTYSAGIVGADGGVDYSTVYKGLAARPAFNLDLNSVLFTSAAEGSAQVSFGQVQAYNGSKWKVTLKDSNSFAQGASVDKTALAAGETLTVTHKALSSFTEAGYNNVTAMLINANEELVCYGSINSETSAASSTITIPEGLAAGEYTLSVYGEQWNDAYKTDYATGTPFETTIHIHSWGDWTSISNTQHTRTCAHDSSHTETAEHTPGTDSSACVCGFHPITSVSISGKTEWEWSADAGHTLTAAASLMEGYDSDNSTMTYAWTKGGEELSGENESAITLTSLDAGDHTYTCTVTVDGYKETGEVTVTVNKAASNPADPTVPNATVGDKLSTVVITPSTEGIQGTWAWESGDSWINTLTYSAKAIFTPGDPNYLTAERTLTITAAPRALTETAIVLNEIEFSYDGGVKKPGVTVKYDDFTFTEGVDYTLTWPEDCVNVGDKIVTITPKEGGGLTGEAATRSFIIYKADAPTVSCETAVIYNATEPVTVDLKPLLEKYLLESDEPTVSVPGSAVLNITANGLVLSILPEGLSDPVGEVEIVINIEGLNNYYDAIVNLTVDITDKIPVTVTGVTAQNGTYTGSAQPGYTGTPSSAYTGTYEITYTGRGNDYDSTTAPTNAGDYTVTFKVPDSDPTYIGNKSLDFSIAKKQIAVPAQPAAVTYNGGAQTYGVASTGDYTVSGGVQTNANETGYDVTIALTDTANTEWANGGIGSLTQKFIINKAALTVTADDKSAIVGATQPTLTYTITGLQGSDQLTTAPNLSCTPDMNTAGVYTITISGAEQNSGNYTITHVDGKLTVSNKATPTLTLTPSKTSLSGGGTVTLTVGGLPTGGSVTVTCDNTTYNPTGSGTTWSVTLPNSTAAYVFTASFAGDATHNSAAATCTVNVTRYTAPSGGGGGYTPPSTPPTQSVTVPISGDDNTINVGASVSGDKATVKDVDLSHLDTVIGDHVEDVGTVTIDFSGLNSSKPITTVEIPSDVVKQIADAVNDPTNDADSFEVVLSNGLSIEFDAVALGEKAAQADGLDITISIENAKDAKPNQKQEAALKGRPAYEISVTSGGEHISDMGGQITVHAPYELQDGEHPRGIIVWYVDEDGNKERCETSYDNVKKRVNWKTDHLSLYMIDYCPSAVFTDLDIGAWYHEAADYVIENGMMAGYGETFGPNDSITRGQIVTILWRMENSPVVNYLMTYEDVDQEQYYAEAIRWATSEGIVSGYGNGGFGPDDPITRQQLATILWRYSQHKGYDVSVGENTNILSYEDAFDISEYAIPAMQWACGAGVMGGYGNGYLGPNDGATRAQAAQMLKNFMEKVAK